MTTTVLYIEDNEDNARLVERILKRRAAITLIVATDGRQGLERALTQHPTLILLDRRLPDMLGDDVLRSLRSAPRTADIPVVLLSGDTVGATQLAVDDVLAKPLDVVQFLAVVDRYCGDPPPRPGTPDAPSRPAPSTDVE
jgi:CheY-like chemotaxis protein